MFGKTKRFYKEVPCKGCKGSGESPRNMTECSTREVTPTILMALQGLCLGCSGRGTQTVLEREEV